MGRNDDVDEEECKDSIKHMMYEAQNSLDAAATSKGDEYSTLVFETKEENLNPIQVTATTMKRYKKKKVHHSLLREEYKDVLPESVQQNATQRQIDAFQLFLLACDMTYIQRNVNDFSRGNFVPHYMGSIKAVKFRGTYYKFDPD